MPGGKKKKKPTAAAAAAAPEPTPAAAAAPQKDGADHKAAAAALQQMANAQTATAPPAAAQTAAATAQTAAPAADASAAAVPVELAPVTTPYVGAAIGEPAVPVVPRAPKAALLPSKATTVRAANAESKTLLYAAPIRYVDYVSELQLPGVAALIERELSEPYSVYTYRYFINLWPHLCLMALADDLPDTPDAAPGNATATTATPAAAAPSATASVSVVDASKAADAKASAAAVNRCVGTIVCKVAPDKQGLRRGYIAMLAVHPAYRSHGIGTRLVQLAIERMRAAPGGCDLVVLQTEASNAGALRLYERLDFVRDKRLARYYLNGGDAFQLKLWFRPPLPPHEAPY